jgi:hypothetical protein
VLEKVIEHQLVQLVDFSMHLKGNILDLVIANCPDKILAVSGAGRLGRSDHEKIIIEIAVENIRYSTDKRPTTLNWRRCDYQGMKDFLASYWWKVNESVDEDWAEFKSILTYLTNEYIPVVKTRSKFRPKWLTVEIMRLIRKKKREWKTAIHYNTGPVVENYKKLEKEVSKKIKNAKKRFEKEMAFNEDRNRKKFSNYVKSKTKSRGSIGPLKNSNNEMTVNKQEMANILNKFFASVFTSEDKNTIPVKEKETDEVLGNVIFTREAVLQKLGDLRADSAAGPDRIFPRILKELRYELAGPLCTLFTKSMNTGVVPQDWKSAIVTPIFKKGAKADPGNYRPVSLTSVPCKIMESIIKDALMDHLLWNNLISDSQHGFVPGRSCATNLLTFQEEITRCIDENVPVDVFYLDFAKAFDKVPHGRLIVKLESKGISGNVKNWIENWLADRTQKVLVEGELSEEEAVKSGVQQGTVMGPPLFTVYIDNIDLFARLAKLFIKFADDGKGMKEIRNRQDAAEMQEALDNLYKWATLWGMKFNVDKCKIMHIGRNNPGYDYYINGEKL